jgi:SAM-dependent methyltransferase
MKIEQVLETYDRKYAMGYDETFLLSHWSRESVAYQLQLLGALLKDAGSWLDVACGTGYALSRFPHVPRRVGLDLSPAMIDVARARNPDVTFRQGNFRDPCPAWNGQWDVVSCMWWAYCMAESMSEIRVLIANLADWTADDGVCFVPLCNPQKFDRENIRIPYVDPKVPGRILITGITWTWIDEQGQRHDEVVSPQVEHVRTMFQEHFDRVEIHEGPLDAIGEGWRVQDVLIASRRKARRPTGRELLTFPEADDERTRRWMLGVQEGNTAILDFPIDRPRVVRVVTDRASLTAPWDVQLFQRRLPVRSGERVRVAFRARADVVRQIGVGVGRAHAPWDGLGWYRNVELMTWWQRVRDEFTATGDDDDARIHFDLGHGLGAVEISDVEVDASAR